MRVQSIIALQKASLDGRAAREQAVHHAGAEEILADLVAEISAMANGDVQ